MSFRIIHTSGGLDVFFGEQHIIHQPFVPTAEGTQEPFASEAAATAWWDSIKAPYEQQYAVDQNTGEE